MAKTATPQYGRGVLHADNPTSQQIDRWRELGGLGAYPATRQAIERAIGYLLAEKAVAECAPTPAIDHAIPGPESNPNDRGECLDLNPQTLVRCNGRRIASREYIQDVGFIVRWSCNKCDWSKVV